MKNIMQQTLAAIVTDDHRAVQVLEKYHLDFCCKGKRTLANACAEMGLPAEEIINELQEIPTQSNPDRMPFQQMTAGQLISHILVHHHFYVKQNMPQIAVHLEKVAAKHGERFPEMIEALSLFSVIREEMTLHMQKEENILFPAIIDAERGVLGTNKSIINSAVNVMETEHDHAGDIMQTIRQLTANYKVPENACTTFKISLAELEAFENDLHKHVHLENNILFPMAIRFSGL